MVVQPVGPHGRILKPESPARKAVQSLPEAWVAWKILTWFGVAAVFIGSFDILLAWYPLRSGNPAWEFGIINLTVWSLPFPSTGLALILAAGMALESKWHIRVAGSALLLLGSLVLGLMVLYALSIPIALQGAPAEVLQNVKKSIVKTVVLGVTFPTLYIVLAISALRRRRQHGE